MKNTILISSYIIILSLFIYGPTMAHTKPTVEISEAYIRMLPPAVTTTAMYMNIKNHTSKDINLIRVKSSLANMVEIHTHKKKNDLFIMSEVSNVKISAKKTVEFKPGGNHIMFMGIKRTLILNQKIPVTLIFKSGYQIQIEVPILRK